MGCPDVDCLAAAAVVIVVAATAAAVAEAQAVAVVAAAAEEQNQNDDPPAAAVTPRTVVTHSHYLQQGFVTAFAVHSMLFLRSKKVRGREYLIQLLCTPDVGISSGNVAHVDRTVTVGVGTFQSIIVGDQCSLPDVGIDHGDITHVHIALLSHITVGEQLRIDINIAVFGIIEVGSGGMSGFHDLQPEIAVGRTTEGVACGRAAENSEGIGISTLVKVDGSGVVFFRQIAGDCNVDIHIHYLTALIAQVICVPVCTGVRDPAAALVAPGVFVGVDTGVPDQHAAIVTPVVPVLVHTAVSHNGGAHHGHQQKTQCKKCKSSFHKITSLSDC